MIVVFGSLNVDVMIAVETLPLPGETVLGPGYRLTAGGKGANQALAAARAGADVVMIGSIGSDPLAETAIADLKAAGIDLSRLARVEEPTGLAAICVDRAGENQIVVASGANTRTSATLVPDALLDSGTILVLQMEVPVSENLALMNRARARGCRVLLNAAPAAPLTLGALQQVDWLVVNEHEAGQLARHLGLGGVSNLQESAQEIAKASGAIVIVTLGAAGATAFARDRDPLAVPALPVHPVDTVGAGDAFVGGLAAAFDRGHQLQDALRFAAVGGALACLRTGAQPSLPSRAEIELRLPDLVP